MIITKNQIVLPYVCAGEDIYPHLQKYAPTAAATLSSYEVTAAAIHSSGLKDAKSLGVKQAVQLDLYRSPFRNSFDAVCMFDVIEHLDDDISALKKIAEALKPEGLLIVTVPAHKFLWSAIDRDGYHKRRYAKKELVDAVKAAGLKPVETRFFFTFITPLLFLRALLYKDRGASQPALSDTEMRESVNINPVVNVSLKIVCAAERFITRLIKFPFGGSLIIAAKKVC